MTRRAANALLVLSMGFVMGLILLGLFSAIRETRVRSVLRCQPGYMLILVRGEHYCTPGYRP